MELDEPKVCAWRACGRTDVVAWTDMGIGPYCWCPEHTAILVGRNTNRPPRPIEGDEFVPCGPDCRHAWHYIPIEGAGPMDDASSDTTWLAEDDTEVTARRGVIFKDGRVALSVYDAAGAGATGYLTPAQAIEVGRKLLALGQDDDG